MIGSGLGASIGWATETTYGTYAAPSRFYQFDKEDFKKVKNTVQGGGLSGGQLAQLASRRVVTTQAAAGTIDKEVVNKGMGLMLSHILGSSATPVQQASSTAYLQTHALGDNTGKYFTLQEGVPDLTGTTRVQTFKGGKVTSAEFTCKVDDLLRMTLAADFQQYSEVETLAAVNYTAGTTAFHFGQMNVKLGATSGSETTVTGVTGIDLKIERGQATDRFYAGGAGLKAEPIGNAWVAVSGSFDVDFVNKADFADRFTSDTQTALVIEWVGPLIASTYYQTFRLKVPAIFLDGDTPVVQGPDRVQGSFPFVAQLDGTNPLITCEYMSVDTTL